jgi:lipid II:glycine glycyltransferase (peptidoglycan interpeptide bridge formation enzyme)
MPDSMEAELERWQAWDRFLETTPDTGFMQSSCWARFRAAVGFDYFAVTLKDGRDIIGGALVTRVPADDDGSCFYYVQEGPVLPADEASAKQVFDGVLQSIERHRHADELTVSHLRIEPRWQTLPHFVQGFEPPAFRDSYWEPRDTLCIDLTCSEGEILSQMRPKGRYNIRVAQRHGVTVAHDISATRLEDFFRIYRRTALRQEMDPKPFGYFRTLLGLFGPHGQAELFFAEHQGRPIATALVLYFGRRATYFFGGSLAIRRQVMAPYLLHFEIMRRAKTLGCVWYDLWGIAPPDEANHPWNNITVFKRKFGGVEVRLAPTLDRVYDRPAYARLKAGARVSNEA